MLICYIPIERLNIGIRVRSRVNGEIGTITNISDEKRREDYEITIKWDNGKTSVCWHFWLDKVEMIGIV